MSVVSLVFNFFGNTLIYNGIPFGVMSGHRSFIFDCPIICKTVNISSTNQTTSLTMHSVFIVRLIAHWSCDNMNLDVTLYGTTLYASVSLTFFSRPKKKYVCLLSHVKKIQGRSVCIKIFFFYYRQNRKQSFPVLESDSGISFSKFPVSRHLLKLFYDELHSFSTFFALNFDKKLNK